MYEFPPPIWMNQDWVAWRIVAVVFFGIVLPCVAAKYSRPNRWVVSSWLLLSTICLCVSADRMAQRYATHDPHRYMVFLPVSVTVIGLCTLIQLWWKATQPQARIHEGVVIAILLIILFAISLPGVSTPVDVSRRTACKNNLKQLGIALHNYHDQWHRFPPAAMGPHEVSWRITMLPFVEQESLAQRYDMTQSWTSPRNTPLSKINVPPYACPSRPKSFNSDGQFFASYIAPTLPGSVFSSTNGTAISEITDGTSNTLLIVEACGTSIVWTSPSDTDSQSTKISVNGPGTAKGQSSSLTSSWHKGGAQVLLADGSARFLSTETNKSLLQALTTKDGGEKVPEW